MKGWCVGGVFPPLSGGVFEREWAISPCQKIFEGVGLADGVFPSPLGCSLERGRGRFAPHQKPYDILALCAF